MKGAESRFSEAELVEGFKCGDRVILSYLYRQNYAAVKSFVLANNGTDTDARDVFQEGMMAAWNNLLKERYESRESKGLEAYLHQICRFRWLERTRSAAFRYSSTLAEQDLSEPDNSFSLLIRKEDIAEARQLLGRVGERCRKILYMFYYHKESMEKIAAEMGLTADSAKNQKYRCLTQLREFYYGKTE
jgi:RNA polymerase sigma factor (sigma-70 family)